MKPGREGVFAEKSNSCHLRLKYTDKQITTLILRDLLLASV